MGKKKSVIHHYADDAERFADLYNVAFFEGRKIIDAKTLRETKTKYSNLMYRQNKK